MSSCPPKINAKKFKNLVRSLTIKKIEWKKKLKKKYEENFLVLYYQSVSVILFLASHSLMVRQKKIRVRSVIYYISRNTIKLKTSLIFGPPSTTVKAQSFSRSDTWSFCRWKIILDRFKMVFYHTCTNITRSWLQTTLEYLL